MIYLYYFSLYGFPEPCLEPVTVSPDSWRYSDRTRLCGVRRGGKVTSFYFSEGVKKGGVYVSFTPSNIDSGVSRFETPER